MMDLLKRLVRDEEGQGLIEYALILVGIAVIVIVTLMTIGGQVSQVFQSIQDMFSNADIDPANNP